MNDTPIDSITDILEDIASGNVSARERLTEITYDELRRLAVMLMRRERVGHTLQPTALVHETLLKIIGNDTSLNDVSGRGSFFWLAARVMRHTLVDHARRRNSDRRGGKRQHVPFDEVIHTLEDRQGIRMVDLNEALDLLEVSNRRQYDVVMLRFFVGLSIEEIADQLSVSPTTVKRDWRYARIWIYRRLNEYS